MSLGYARPDMLGLFLADTFIEALTGLPRETVAKVAKAMRFFRRDPHHPGLNFEALHRDGLFSVRVDRNYRIILRQGGTAPALLYVGNHDDSYKFAARTPEWCDQLGPEPPEAVHAYAPRGTPVAQTSSYVLPVLPAPIDAVESLIGTRKYLPLAHLLLSKPDAAARAQLTFPELEKIIGDTLPPAARKHRAWWSNSHKRHVQASAWLAVGWRVKQVDLSGETVSFERVEVRVVSNPSDLLPIQ